MRNLKKLWNFYIFTPADLFIYAALAIKKNIVYTPITTKKERHFFL
jgi:hypothetical protein